VFWSPGWNYAKHIKIDKNGDIIIAGYATSLADFDPGPALGYLGNNATANYIYIAKYDANGNYIWAQEMGNNFGAFIGSLDIDNNNNIFITGHFYGTNDMDLDTGTAILVSNQERIFTAKYTQNGNYVWANCISGIGNLGESFSLKCGTLGKVYENDGNHKVTDYRNSKQIWLKDNDSTICQKITNIAQIFTGKPVENM
jgi:hypothetical protein